MYKEKRMRGPREWENESLDLVSSVREGVLLLLYGEKREDEHTQNRELNKEEQGLVFIYITYA